MTSPSTSGRFVPDLERRRQELPRLIENVLSEFGLLAVFLGRPTYQRDDYVLAITRTERPETRDTRIADMLDELAGAEREVGVSSNQEVSP